MAGRKTTRKLVWRVGAAVICAIVVGGLAGFAQQYLFPSDGGPTRVAQTKDETDGAVAQKTIDIAFTGDIESNLPWRFAPEQKKMTVALGENRMAFYSAENVSDETITGQAAYSVSPIEAGMYVNKLACFCFNEQRLEPGQQTDMPISFFVDPAIADDPAMRDVKTITLSFTFYRAKTTVKADGQEKSGG